MGGVGTCRVAWSGIDMSTRMRVRETKRGAQNGECWGEEGKRVDGWFICVFA